MKTGITETEKAVEIVMVPQAEYEELLSQYKKLTTWVEQLEAQNRWLLEQLRVIRQRKFGASSEKASEEVVEQFSLLFDEAEVYVAEESKEEAPAVEVRSHTRSVRRHFRYKL